jgi:hypothetical protein
VSAGLGGCTMMEYVPVVILEILWNALTATFSVRPLPPPRRQSNSDSLVVSPHSYEDRSDRNLMTETEPLNHALVATGIVGL